MKLAGVGIANGIAGIKVQDNNDGTYSVFLIHYGDKSFKDVIVLEKIGIELDAETADALGISWDDESCRYIPNQPESVRAEILFKILES